VFILLAIASSDCLQPKFPAFRICKLKKIQMLQIGGGFDRVLVGSSKTFLSLQE
jgi:hypothetical protein